MQFYFKCYALNFQYANKPTPLICSSWHCFLSDSASTLCGEHRDNTLYGRGNYFGYKAEQKVLQTTSCVHLFHVAHSGQQLGGDRLQLQQVHPIERTLQQVHDGCQLNWRNITEAINRRIGQRNCLPACFRQYHSAVDR